MGGLGGLSETKALYKPEPKSLCFWIAPKPTTLLPGWARERRLRMARKCRNTSGWQRDSWAEPPGTETAP